MIIPLVETLPVRAGNEASLSFTSGGLADRIEGKPEVELLVALVGDGRLELENDGKLEEEGG